MKPIRLLQALFFVLALTAAGAAQANEAQLLSKHGDWLAYTFVEDGNKVCFMASKPKSDQGAYSQRGEIFALITHRPAEGSKNVFSYIAGYPYQTGSDVTITVDGNRFTLFTQDDTAWMPDAAADNKLLDAIRKGSKLVVKGTSSRGTATTDTFSLKGSSGAHDAISRECGI